jgi:hypothetical protein
VAGESPGSRVPSGTPRRRWPARLVGGLGAAALVAAAVVGLRAGDQADLSLSGEGAQAAAAGDERSLAELFTGAADALSQAGSFRYEGTRDFRNVDVEQHTTPDRDLDYGKMDVRGEVELPGDVHEVTEYRIGYYIENVGVSLPAGPAVWVRFSAYPDQLDQRQWAQVPELGSPDMSLLPEWLGGATEHFRDGEDPGGRPIVRAEVARALFGAVSEEIDSAEIALTLDDDGTPRAVDLMLNGSSWTLDQHVRLADLGADVAVRLPGATSRDDTPRLAEEDLALFDDPVALGVGSVPEGWDMEGAFVVPDIESGCLQALVAYYGESEDDYLEVATIDAGCLSEDDTEDGDPLDVAGFSGVAHQDDDIYSGTLVSGEVGLSFETTLTADATQRLLETLAEFDPEDEPAHIDVEG